METNQSGRIMVTSEELERAIAVWLKTMPRHLWRAYEAMLAVDEKRRNPDDRVDPHHVLAAYLAGKFAQVKWEATYPAPPPPGDYNSPTPRAD
jgi:hypothetical protein